MDLERVVVKFMADASQYNLVMTGVESRLLRFARQANSMNEIMIAPLYAAGQALMSFTNAVVESGVAAVQAAMHYEQMSIQLRVMAGDVEKGTRLMEDLFQTAVTTPFHLKEVVAAGKQISAFGFETEEIIPVLKTLGDISAGTGTTMHRLILAFGQARIAGRLMGQEMRQFVNSNVPMVENLAAVMGKPTVQIKKMIENGKVGFDVVVQAINRMTREGGRFANLMDEINRTTKGQWISFTETLEIAGARIGQTFMREFKLKELFTSWRLALNEVDPNSGGVATFFRNLHDTLIRIKESVSDITTTIYGLFQFIGSGLMNWISRNEVLILTVVKLAAWLSFVASSLYVIRTIAFFLTAPFLVLGAYITTLTPIVGGLVTAFLVLEDPIMIFRNMLDYLRGAAEGVQNFNASLEKVIVSLAIISGLFLNWKATLLVVTGAFSLFDAPFQKLQDLISVFTGVESSSASLITTLQRIGGTLIVVIAAFSAFKIAVLSVTLAWTALTSLFGLTWVYARIAAGYASIAASIILVQTALVGAYTSLKLFLTTSTALITAFRLMKGAVASLTAVFISLKTAVFVLSFISIFSPLAAGIATCTSLFVSMLAAIIPVSVAMIALNAIAGILTAGFLALVAAVGYFIIKSIDFRSTWERMGSMFQSLVGIIKKTWKGVMDAMSAGDMELAGEIAFKGLEIAFKTVVVAIKEEWIRLKNWMMSGAFALEVGGQINRALKEAQPAWWFGGEEQKKKAMADFDARHKALMDRLNLHHQIKMEVELKGLSDPIKKAQQELDGLLLKANKLAELAKAEGWVKAFIPLRNEIQDFTKEYETTQTERLEKLSRWMTFEKALNNWKKDQFMPMEVYKTLVDFGIHDGKGGVPIYEDRSKYLDLLKFRDNQGGFSEKFRGLKTEYDKYAEGFKGRLSGAMRDVTKVLTPAIMDLLAIQRQIISGGTGGDIVRYNQIPEKYAISPEAKSIAEKYYQQHARGVGEETNKLDFFLQQAKFIEEARTGMTPFMKKMYEATDNKIIRAGMEKQFKLNVALEKDEADYGLLTEFDKVKKWVGDRNVMGPSAMLEGSSQAQDTINRNMQQQTSVFDEVRITLLTANEMQKMQLQYQKEQLDALQKLIGEKPVAPMPREVRRDGLWNWFVDTP